VRRATLSWSSSQGHPPTDSNLPGQQRCHHSDDLEGGVIMKGENNAWSRHGVKIRGTDDRQTIAREFNDTITESCMNQDSIRYLGQGKRVPS
jgi:hypothetical protein